MKEVSWWVDIVLIMISGCRMLLVVIWNLLSNECNDSLYVVLWIVLVMTRRGTIFHPSWTTLSSKGWYFWILYCRKSRENRSWQKVKSINWIVRCGNGVVSGGFLYGRPLTLLAYTFNVKSKHQNSKKNSLYNVFFHSWAISKLMTN